MTRFLLAIICIFTITIFSCTTTGFAGLAKESYAAEIDQRTSTEIQQLKDEVNKMKALTDQLETLLKDMEDAKKSTKEFRDTIKDLQDRMKTMPRENLQKLVEILQKYLDETK